MQNPRGRSEERRPRSKSRPEQPRRAVSHDSSVSSSSREVRCGCQFFQSDSLLPERVNPVGRPVSRNSFNMASSSPQVGWVQLRGWWRLNPHRSAQWYVVVTHFMLKVIWLPVYLWLVATISAAVITRCPTVGRVVNNEFRRTWKEAPAAQF